MITSLDHMWWHSLIALAPIFIFFHFHFYFSLHFFPLRALIIAALLGSPALQLSRQELGPTIQDEGHGELQVFRLV